jgi:DNA repair protein RecN (Recombination protein N)
MLQSLKIENFALIKHLQIDFENQLNIITGETGAGKSVLLGALSLILGERADSKSTSTGKKCIIEGSFSIQPYQLQSFFAENDLDYDEVSILRREISGAKSRAFINDTPVPLNLLKELGEKLVDIHSQHETLELNANQFQLGVVDAFAQHRELLDNYVSLYREHKTARQKLTEMLEHEARLRKEEEFNKFVYNELSAARLDEGDTEKLETEHSLLSNAEEIQKNCYGTLNILLEQEGNAADQLAAARTQLAPVAKYHNGIAEILKRIEASMVEIKDIAGDIESLAENTVADSSRLEELNARLDLIYQLQNKHRVNSVEELIGIRDSLQQELTGLQSLEEEIELLKMQQLQQQQKLSVMAAKLSANRKKQLPKIEQAVKELLSQVGMPHAELKVSLTQSEPPIFNESGIDRVSFMFSSNKGAAFMPLNKVASGGELSRLMLCIKSLIADFTALPTVIFDEIDTGVSGETANKVGRIMEQLSAKHQVITITHLPQIAAKGNAHYFVYKEAGKDSTTTLIRKLDEKGRMLEIAKMLSGDNPGESAMANARELIG